MSEESEKDDLLDRYGAEAMRLLAMLGAHAAAKGCPLSLSDFMGLLAIICTDVVAMHCVDEPEKLPQVMRDFGESLSALGDIDDTDADYRDAWVKDGSELYQRMLTQQQLRKLSKAEFSTGDDPETLH